MSIDWEFDLNFDGLREQIEAKKVPAAMKAMEHIRGYVAEGTPIETGHLVGSEAVEPIDDGARIFIPGPYARAQEFDMSFHHNTGHALFLTLPMATKADEAIRIIADELT